MLQTVSSDRFRPFFEIILNNFSDPKAVFTDRNRSEYNSITNTMLKSVTRNPLELHGRCEN